jgi:hypothetical protein
MQAGVCDYRFYDKKQWFFGFFMDSYLLTKLYIV